MVPRWKHTCSILFFIVGKFCLFHSDAQELKPKPHLSGGIRAEAGYLWQSNNNYSSRPPFIGNIYADPRLSYGKFTISSLIQLGTLADQYKQAFNRIGISPQYKWITVHLGHRYYNYSPYSANGRTIWGAGIDLMPGKFRFSAFYGNLRRETSVPSGNVTEFSSFARRSMGVRIGAGRPSNHADLIVIKSADDTSRFSPENIHSYPAPQENAVIAITSRQRIAKRFYLSLDGSLSALTRDTRKDTITIDESFPLKKELLSFYHPRYSSQYFTAAAFALEYRLKDHSVGVTYERIDPDYTSLSALTIQNDRIKAGINTRLNFLQNRLSIVAGAGDEKNNIIQHRKATTTKTMGNISVMYRTVEKFSGNLSYHLFRLRQASEATLLSHSTTHNFQAGGNWQLPGSRRVISAITVGSRQNRITGSRDYANVFARGSYDFIFRKKQRIAPELGVGIFQYGAANNSIRINPSARIYNATTRSPLSWTISAGSNLTYSASRLRGAVIFTGTGLGYLLKKKHQLNLRANFSANLYSVLAYQEFRADFSYSYRF
ncbi:MAG: hypothetical protein IT223_06735 [Crocinitomicaceae bacterium]|nr:hypothetical protein [Crocinitomicaceae bacterium]